MLVHEAGVGLRAQPALAGDDQPDQRAPRPGLRARCRPVVVPAVAHPLHVHVRADLRVGGIQEALDARCVGVREDLEAEGREVRLLVVEPDLVRDQIAQRVPGQRRECSDANASSGGSLRQ